MRPRGERTGIGVGRWSALLVCAVVVVLAVGEPAYPRTADPSFVGVQLPAPRLHLAWADPHRALPFSFGHVARELEGALGVEVSWRSAATAPWVAEREITVVLLDSEPPGSVVPCAMGSTKRRLVRGSLWVMLPNLKRTLGLSPAPGRSFHGTSPALLARALARVIAHEILHVVAPTMPHARDGLMAPSLGRSQLVGDALRLDTESRRALHDALDADWRPGEGGGAPPTR